MLGPWRPTPLDPIFDEIIRANEAGLSHGALALTLTIPDICCALISPRGKSSSEAYAKWFDDNMAGYRDRLPGKDVYQLRCGFLHEARTDRPNMKWERVVFDTTYGNHKCSISGMQVNGVRQPNTFTVSVVHFGYEMIDAAQAWLEKHRDNENVVKNSDKVVRYRPNVVPGVFGIGGIC